MSGASRSTLETDMTETPARSAMSFKRIMASDGRWPWLWTLDVGLWTQTLVPLQFSFRRRVLKKELPARCSNWIDCALLRIVITSPAANGKVVCPSAVRITSTFWLMTLTSTVELRLTNTERFESVCGQIG